MPYHTHKSNFFFIYVDAFPVMDKGLFAQFHVQFGQVFCILKGVVKRFWPLTFMVEVI